MERGYVSRESGVGLGRQQESGALALPFFQLHTYNQPGPARALAHRM
jgi:hypothetical protein